MGFGYKNCNYLIDIGNGEFLHADDYNLGPVELLDLIWNIQIAFYFLLCGGIHIAVFSLIYRVNLFFFEPFLKDLFSISLKLMCA